jgi:23S rRNA pseudouridine1911/1915/1917 synthase
MTVCGVPWGMREWSGTSGTSPGAPHDRSVRMLAMPEATETFTVDEKHAGTRLDRYVADVAPGLSRTRAQALIERGAVRVEGQPVRASHLLEAGQRVDVERDAAGPARIEGRPIEAESIAVPVVYEDAYLIVIDKPAGLVVHPAPGHPAGTVVNALLDRLAPAGGEGQALRPGIVHRLDKDTSGLMVVARDQATLAHLAAQMKERRTVKRYLTLVEGRMPVPEGVIEAPIGRDPRQRQRMALVSVPAGGREARTRFRVLREARGRSLLELQLETGRTHQIRVHLAAVGHPVVGDPTYGHAQPPRPPRMFLHSAHLEFEHPATHEWQTFDVPLPPDLARFLADWER